MSVAVHRPGHLALTLTAGEEPSLGQDPCITLWWPLTSNSHFTLTTPSATVSPEGITFVPTSANFTTPLCLLWSVWGGGNQHLTTVPTTPFGPTINFQIHLFTSWKPSMWFKAPTPINTILACYHKVAAVYCQRGQMGLELSANKDWKSVWFKMLAM